MLRKRDVRSYLRGSGKGTIQGLGVKTALFNIQAHPMDYAAMAVCNNTVLVGTDDVLPCTGGKAIVFPNNANKDIANSQLRIPTRAKPCNETASRCLRMLQDRDRDLDERKLQDVL